MKLLFAILTFVLIGCSSAVRDVAAPSQSCSSNSCQYPNSTRVSHGWINSNQIYTQKIDLTNGKTTIWVTTTQNVNCTFYDSNGNVGLERKNVSNCTGIANLINPTYITLKLETLEKSSKFEIYVIKN